MLVCCVHFYMLKLSHFIIFTIYTYKKCEFGCKFNFPGYMCIRHPYGIMYSCSVNYIALSIGHATQLNYKISKHEYCWINTLQVTLGKCMFVKNLVGVILFTRHVSDALLKCSRQGCQKHGFFFRKTPGFWVFPDFSGFFRVFLGFSGLLWVFPIFCLKSY